MKVSELIAHLQSRSEIWDYEAVYHDGTYDIEIGTVHANPETRQALFSVSIILTPTEHDSCDCNWQD